MLVLCSLLIFPCCYLICCLYCTGIHSTSWGWRPGGGGKDTGTIILIFMILIENIQLHTVHNSNSPLSSNALCTCLLCMLRYTRCMHADVQSCNDKLGLVVGRKKNDPLCISNLSKFSNFYVQDFIFKCNSPLF